jgi:uncharacterized protein (DUF1330 family)
MDVAAYQIADMEVTDTQAYDEYRQKVPAAIEACEVRTAKGRMG